MLTCHFCTTPVALSFCTALSKHLTMNDTFTSMYVTGQHKNKASLRQTRVYYPFASTHMVNTQLLRVQNVHTKYRKYFRGFFNSRLLNLREIREN